MVMIYVFMANGFEEKEALAPVDILGRGGQDGSRVRVTGTLWVESSHGITVKADMLLLPGGMPGSVNLNTHEGLRLTLLQHAERGGRIGAICAAPMVLGSLGLLQGRRATCSPGFEVYLDGAEYTAELVTVDGNIITGEGPGASLPYAYTILSFFVGDEAVHTLQKKMQSLHLMESTTEQE